MIPGRPGVAQIGEGDSQGGTSQGLPNLPLRQGR